MRAYLLVLCLLVASLVLAGCTTTETTDETIVPADSSGVETPPSGPAFSDCVQFHTMFTVRAQDFQVPNGYTIVTNDAGLATLFVIPTACPDRQALVISLPVDVPADRAVADHEHHFVLEIYADQETAAWLDAKGIPAVACECQLDRSSDLHPVFHMDGGGHAYTARFVITPSSGPFTEGPIAYFTAGGDRVLLQGQGNATNLGVGDVLLQYAGPGGAPPVALGNIAHAVHGLQFDWGVQ